MNLTTNLMWFRDGLRVFQCLKLIGNDGLSTNSSLHEMRAANRGKKIPQQTHFLTINKTLTTCLIKFPKEEERVRGFYYHLSFCFFILFCLVGFS